METLHIIRLVRQTPLSPVDYLYVGPVIWNFDDYFEVNLGMLLNKASDGVWIDNLTHCGRVTHIYGIKVIYNW